MPTETIFYLKCFLKRRISIVSIGSSIHNCTDCSLDNTCQSRSHALATYSNFQNYRQYPSALNQPTAIPLTDAQKRTGDGFRQKFGSPALPFAQKRLYLRPQHLNRIHIGAVRRQIPQLCACGVICVVCHRRSTAAFCPARAAFCPFFSSPCDILYHSLLQLSRVTAILEVAIKSPNSYRICDSCLGFLPSIAIPCIQNICKIMLF